MTTSDTKELILATLEKFLSESGEDSRKLRNAAASLRALPLMSDMGGCYLIRPDGEIISFQWDSPDDWRREDNTRIRNIVLCHGSRKYPALEGLSPDRPSSAKECPHCGGTGKESMAAKLGLDNINCYCGGLGWIPSDDPGGLTEF